MKALTPLKGFISCDKCGSFNVEETDISRLNEEPKTWSMSEWSSRERFPVTTFVMKYTSYKLLCKDCGYSLAYLK